MSTSEVPSGRPRNEHAHVRQSAIVAVLIAAVALGGLIAVASRDSKKSIAWSTTTPVSVAADPTATDPAADSTSAPAASAPAAADPTATAPAAADPAAAVDAQD